jgi:hypothetical protein
MALPRIPILFIDCRPVATHRGELPDSVIPAEAGIQAFIFCIMYKYFQQFLTMIGISLAAKAAREILTRNKNMSRGV